MLKKSRTATLTFTSDFSHSYAAETDTLLLRHFIWFAGVMIGLNVLAWLLIGLGLATGRSMTDLISTSSGDVSRAVLAIVVLGMSMLVYVAGIVYGWLERPSGAMLLRLTMFVITADGIANVALRALDMNQSMGLIGFMVSHTLASCFLPWTPRQALKPAYIVLGVSAVSRLLIEVPTIFDTGVGSLGNDIFAIAFSPLAVLPGTAICWFRDTRRLEKYKLRFLQQRYGEVRRELTDARKIHESLFPMESDEGAVRFTYRYEPMRQIGGDFLYVCPAPMRSTSGAGDGLNVVLIDVTGHGIPAALTVNRIHGELERIFAEDPLIPPGEVLALLNRYVHLTLSPHSIYGTAMCVRVDPESNELEYASGGHPPAFVRAVDGTLDRLDSTSFVLGACPYEAFDPDPQKREFGPGDSLILYSDGATEARALGGMMLGIEGFERILATRNVGYGGGWSELLLREIEAFRGGAAEDDTLIVELYRPLQNKKGDVNIEENVGGSAKKMSRGAEGQGAAVSP